MLQPLRHARGSRVSRSVAIPPPVGGWNARDALDQMKAEDAIVLDNWFPAENEIVSRRGYAEHCDTGEGAAIESIHEYAGDGSRVLIAGCNGKLLNVSTSTVSSLATGFTENRWHGTNYKDRLFLVNGTDTPQTYDGSSVAGGGWSGSGLTDTNLIAVHAHKERLYFIEKNTTNLWYAASAGNVTGTLNKYDVGALGNISGKLVCMGTITQDGGDGVDDLFCAITSSGDVAIFQGSNPGDANAWSLAGIFHIGAPIDAFSTLKVGSDLVVITRDGFIPLTRVLPFGRSTQTNAISDKIAHAAQTAVSQYAANDGWQILLYPAGQQLLFNVPTNATTRHQYVMNTETQAWCRYTGINANCWALFNDSPYFGAADGVVYEWDTGYDDNGAAIVTDAQTAWNYFGDRGSLKHFKMARLLLVSDGQPGLVIGFGADFNTTVPTNTVTTPSDTISAVWDEAVWDVDIWGGAETSNVVWQGITGIGYCGQLRARTSNDDRLVRWRSWTVVYESGGLI